MLSIKKLELTEKGINREDLFQLISYSYILEAEKAGLFSERGQGG